MRVNEERIPKVRLITVRQLLLQNNLVVLTHFRQSLPVLLVEAIVAEPEGDGDTDLSAETRHYRNLATFIPRSFLLLERLCALCTC